MICTKEVDMANSREDPLHPINPNQHATHTEQTKYQAKKQLSDAIKGSNDTIITAKTVFPFTLFPDTVIIDRDKISVTQRFFFKLSETVSIQIEDVLNVAMDAGPFFGSLSISTRFFSPERPYKINYLWRHDAIKIKHILEGYVIALQKGINCSALGAGELAKFLEKIGHSAPGEEI